MDELTQTEIAQVAIFVVSVAMLRCLSFTPDVCAGLSLGEYTALVASGRIDFKEALTLVRARGKYMQEACEKEKGTMRVVLGLEEEKSPLRFPKASGSPTSIARDKSSSRAASAPCLPPKNS